VLILLIAICVGLSSAGIIEIINALVKTNLPKLNELLVTNIPNSYGNCNDNGPAQPCLCSPGCNDLYYIHKSWLYEAYARWIEGLRSINVTSIVFSDANPVVTIDIHGYFGNLPLSLWIGECLTFDQCVNIWDNTNGCCGTNKNFQVNISVNCQNQFPYLIQPKLNEIVMDQFEITENIIGIKVDVADITNTVEQAFSGLLTTYLTTDAFINYNGTMVTLLQFANYEIRDKTNGAFVCPSNEKQFPHYFINYA